MNYLPILALLLLVALFAYRCIGGVEKKLVYTGEHDSCQIAVYEHVTTVGFGAYSHSAHLFWNNKELTQWHHTWPLQPEKYPDWVVKTFSEAPDAWTIYVSPYLPENFQFDGRNRKNV